MATYSRILAWRIPWTEVAESDMTEATEHEVKNEKKWKEFRLNPESRNSRLIFKKRKNGKNNFNIFLFCNIIYI